jgi:hypothetical protein
MSSAVERVQATLAHLNPAGKYEYTCASSSTVLSREQRDQYERDGFILVKGLVSTDNLKKYADRFVQFAKNELPRPESMVSTYHSDTAESYLRHVDHDERRIPRQERGIR